MLKLQSSLKATCMAVAALTALSCSQEDLTGKAPIGNTTINASFETPGAGTRTSVKDNGDVVWNTNDTFGLFYTTTANTTPAVAQFTTTSADGSSTTASFTGTLDDGVTTSYAVYPYQAGMQLSGATVTTTLPKEFAYTEASNGPMYADASTYSNGISFKHLAGLLKLQISSAIGSTAKKFVITADKAIAGTATANLSTTDTEPVLAVADDTNNSKTITVTLSFTADRNPTTFFIPIPVGTYATLSAKLLGESDKELYTPKEWKDVTVTRAGMLTAAFGYIKIDAGIATGKGISDAISSALPTEAPATPITNEIAVPAKIDATASDATALQVPAVQNSNVTLSLEEIPTTTATKPLVLQESGTATTTPTAAVNTVTVAIPKVTEASTAPSITITMPKTTVELDANGTEGTTYNTIIAKTATNTLVVKAGVTVEKLIIAGGNVVIYGTVKELIRDTNNNATVEVASFDAADIEKVDTPANFKFTATWDGTSKTAKRESIYTAAQLAAYQSTDIPVSTTGIGLSATITTSPTLYADIDLNNRPWVGMVLDKNQTFNGGDHTISNILVTEHILSETSKYTPEACVGLFAASKLGSIIKGVKINGFKAEGAGANAKWSGALVGLSQGAAFTDCHVENVTIESESDNSYRIGGLIGFLRNESAVPTLTNCSAKNVKIKAGFCLAGLVGSIQKKGASFVNCKTEGITLAVNAKSAALNGAFSDTTFVAPYRYWAGYMSKFIGEVNIGSNTITIDSQCSVAGGNFTKTEEASFGYSDMAKYSYSKTADAATKAAAISNAPHYSLTSGNIFLPACVDGGKVTVAGSTLTDGKDYNLFTTIQSAGWDGTSKKQPSKIDNVYQIKTAAELAYFQSKAAPTETTAGNLPATLDAKAVLCNDINLANKPWLGMVLKDQTFDGQGHTIKNLNMSQYILDQQQTTFSPQACIGLFAAVYGASTVKGITLENVSIKPVGSPKWVGSLVGYSKGNTTYTDCIVKNADISAQGKTSIRVGGLIGYIEKSAADGDPSKVTLTGCEVNKASISASYSYGGLVGSMYDSATFTNCKTSGITLALNKDATAYRGYVSKFIGDIANIAVDYKREILINSCTTDDLTDAEKTALDFGKVISQQKSSYLSGTYVGGCKWCGLVEPVAGVVASTNFTIKVDGNTLKNGVDFNVCK
ncbi:fimbrillin family protein [Bacteroides helcogenes]|uniref:GLUG domain-containing protein n=1 Tax=Bacteroides helcogenes (strain ATCC 35417 / DSM 20613 / JCM 6297 / CCUG 15421 / P 36-108) TaxID=693979 RepID=E6SUZ9_BACT6|nr:fimbrillin family protein [Bacteroides helcogenes]ADV42435.1 hypothetical protein Bache_0408 [Bacteroides helcogenes P 36-108]MDY5237802.1 fimbrillin family protein [Bacteroides helcogenes]